MRLSGLLLVVFGLLTAETCLANPSFDCAKATQPVEKLICQSNNLSVLDVRMSDAFRKALANAGASRKDTIEIQRRWLKDRAKTCSISEGQATEAEACLGELYVARIKALGGDPDPVIAKSGKDVCGTLEHWLKALYARGKPDTLPVWALAQLPESVLHIDVLTSGWGDRAEEELNSSFHADKELLAEADELEGDMVDILRLGHSSVYAVASEGGTMHCQNFVFFDAANPKSAKLIDGPRGEYCEDKRAYMGEIEGTPAFIVEDYEPASIEITVTPRQAKAWSKSCHVSLSFPIVFGSETLCPESGCDQDWGAISVELAGHFDESQVPPDDTEQPKTAAVVAQIARMLELSRAEEIYRSRTQLVPDLEVPSSPWIDVPSFKENFQNGGAYFIGDFQVFAKTVGGTTYLVRLGSGSFGRDTAPGYFVAFYKLSDDKLQPVASTYVWKGHGDLKSVSSD